MDGVAAANGIEGVVAKGLGAPLESHRCVRLIRVCIILPPGGVWGGVAAKGTILTYTNAAAPLGVTGRGCDLNAHRTSYADRQRVRS